MLLLDRRCVEAVVEVERVVDVVEEAFAAHGRGETIMPPKIYLSLPQYQGDFRAMPAYVGGCAGLKWVNVHPRNPESHGLPTVMALIIYSDPRTGVPLAVIEAGLITALRTAAAAAVATKYLAKPSARTLGIVGCGGQALSQIKAVTSVMKIDEIRLSDVNQARIESLLEQLGGLPGRAASLREAVESDVVCTLTPSTKPVVLREWVLPGTHINAVGADAPGKQELDPRILTEAKVFVDDYEQASHSGEINVPIAAGEYSTEQVAGTLGQVVAGRLKGRTGQEITVFDSTGLAVQDIATACYVYEESRRRGLGIEVDMF